MRVLVTGGTGFVGSHAVAALHADGHELRLLARYTGAGSRAARRARTRSRGRGLPGRHHTRMRSAQRCTRCDAVVHAAAVVGIDGAKAAAARTTNERGARNVLGAAVELGADPIVYVSSISALFGPRGPVLLTSQTPVASATSPYSASKAACERYARQLQEAGHPVVCIYPGGILGRTTRDCPRRCAERSSGAV